MPPLFSALRLEFVTPMVLGQKETLFPLFCLFDLVFGSQGSQKEELVVELP